MAKLDDFLVKKKETAPILDLSKTLANSKEELRRLLEKVPDFKIKPEKVPPETIKIKEKKFTFKSNKIGKGKKGKYPFLDPVPPEMKNLKIEDLISVPIDWKMLTNLRPKNKGEENYFSRMIELGKLQNKSKLQEKKQFQIDTQIKKTKNKSGVVEMRVISCTECGEEFCNGKTCCKYGYESFARLPETLKTDKIVPSSSGAIPKRKIKRRSRSKSKLKKGNTAAKSKSPKKQSKSRKNHL